MRQMIQGVGAGGALGAALGLAHAAVFVVFQQQFLDHGLVWLAIESTIERAARGATLGVLIGFAATLPQVAGGRAGGEDSRRRVAMGGASAMGGAFAIAASLASITWIVHPLYNWFRYFVETAPSTIALHVSGVLVASAAFGLGTLALARLRVSSLALVVVLPAVFSGLLTPLLRPIPPGSNLLLVSVDSLRADRLSPYGYAEARTANIQSLAEAGAVWETVVASAPVTLVAMSTLMTGLDPGEHGVRYNGFYKLGRTSVTLAEDLRNRGYDTAAVIGNFALDHTFRIDQGFAFYDDTMTQNMSTETRKADAGPVGWWKEFRRTHPAQRFANEITDAAAAWLGDQGEDPWFLWVHYMDPHKPYAAPDEFAGRDPYDAEIAFTDHEIGRLLEALSARDDADDTLVVFIADHGESLGEHGFIGHVRVLYDQTLLVPLIMRHSTLVPAGARLRSPLRARDVRGVITGILEGQAISREEGAGRAAYSETYWPRMGMGEQPLRALRDARWKYIRQQGGALELYDLDADPKELDNVVSRFPERAAEMQTLLDALTELEMDAPVEVDAATLEKLEALGYIN